MYPYNWPQLHLRLAILLSFCVIRVQFSRRYANVHTDMTLCNFNSVSLLIVFITHTRFTYDKLDPHS